jgi:hypothetical protein
MARVGRGHTSPVLGWSGKGWQVPQAPPPPPPCVPRGIVCRGFAHHPIPGTRVFLRWLPSTPPTPTPTPLSSPRPSPTFPDPCPWQCAGLAGGNTFGVAKNASLVSVRVVNCLGVGSWDDIVLGVNWVISDDRVPNSRKVMSMSLGGSTSSNIVDEAVRVAVETYGITTTIAAGNSDAPACDQSPARSASGRGAEGGVWALLEVSCPPLSLLASLACPSPPPPVPWAAVAPP